MFHWIGKRLAHFLMTPASGLMPLTLVSPEALAGTIRPGDVLLVDGHSRVSTVIKYLTQSTWSHSVLYVGAIPGRFSETGEPHVLVEADVEYGVISAPLSKYAMSHTRVCRPIGLSDENTRRVIQFAVSSIGHKYDLRNLFDLFRYFLPILPVPRQFRRRIMAVGAGDPTRAICSTLIAHAFQSINYPILPQLEHLEGGRACVGLEQEAAAQLREMRHVQHHSLFVPRDFDISPYFAIVKPTLEDGFDFRQISRAARIVEDEAQSE